MSHLQHTLGLGPGQARSSRRFGPVIRPLTGMMLLPPMGVLTAVTARRDCFGAVASPDSCRVSTNLDMGRSRATPARATHAPCHIRPCHIRPCHTRPVPHLSVPHPPRATSVRATSVRATPWHSCSLGCVKHLVLDQWFPNLSWQAPLHLSQGVIQSHIHRLTHICCVNN